MSKKEFVFSPTEFSKRFPLSEIEKIAKEKGITPGELMESGELYEILEKEWRENQSEVEIVEEKLYLGKKCEKGDLSDFKEISRVGVGEGLKNGLNQKKIRLKKEEMKDVVKILISVPKKYYDTIAEHNKVAGKKISMTRYYQNICIKNSRNLISRLKRKN